MTAQNLGRNRPSLLPEINHEGLAAFLYAQHPNKTAMAVEGKTRGVLSWQTVRNWLEKRNGLRADHMLVLAHFYGPDVLLATWPASWGDAPGWLDVAAASDELAKIDANREREENRRLAALARLNGGTQ